MTAKKIAVKNCKFAERNFWRIILANFSSEVVHALSRQGPRYQQALSATNPALLASWQFERLPRAPFELVAFRWP
jgi:hypothetical protein